MSVAVCFPAADACTPWKNDDERALDELSS
jgi:hypothetical protein